MENNKPKDILELVLYDLVEAPAHVRETLERDLRARSALPASETDPLLGAYRQALDTILSLRQLCADNVMDAGADLIYWDALQVAINLCDKLKGRNHDATPV